MKRFYTTILILSLSLLPVVGFQSCVPAIGGSKIPGVVAPKTFDQSLYATDTAIIIAARVTKRLYVQGVVKDPLRLKISGYLKQASFLMDAAWDFYLLDKSQAAAELKHQEAKAVLAEAEYLLPEGALNNEQ